jgi:pimeloyl-ACP methyl ester carboxylesterase
LGTSYIYFVNVYFISGLGADRRAFQKIRLSDSFKVHHIDWIEPYAGESFPAYVGRLMKQVDLSSPFSLVGLSFGGVVAVEMAKISQPEKIIILSSLSRSSELPKKFRFISALNLHRVIPAAVYKKPTKLIARFFGAKTHSDRKLLYEIFEDSSAVFLKWAVDKLLKWKNERRPERLFHIHGEKDQLLPITCVNQNMSIPDAGHLMVLTHASVISETLERHLGGHLNYDRL